MATSLFDLDPLLPALEAGDPILTANDRLRRHLLKAWSEHQRRQGHRAWEAPPVSPLNRWLDRQWQTLMERGHPGCDRALAKPHQCLWLWEQVINQSGDAQALLQPEPLAQEANRALRSLVLWQIEPDSLADDPYLNGNTRRFLDWVKPFEQRLARRGLLLPEAAHRVIAEAFEQGNLPREERLWLLGFDALPPLHRRILTAAAGETPEITPNGAPSPRCRRVSAPDTDTEIRSAALWSQQQLNADPEAVVGIIVPDLGQRRDQIERLFAEVFEPGTVLPDRPRYTPPFNFSAGVPLGGTPLIHSALALLGLLRDQWPLTELCTLLHNPFWGDADAELVLRAQLSQRLKELGKFELTGSDLRYHGQKLAEQLNPELEGAGALIKRLQRLDEERRRLPRQASAREWARLLRARLETLGWPGARRLDSQEYQQMTQWFELLETFAALEATGTDMTLSQALGQLGRIAQQTHFQAQTPDSPVQILGALEGAGLRFTHCWVMGLHQRQWPPVPAPNPLLPLELQREKAMPHASNERELQYATSLTRQYRRCAEEVIVSTAVGDEQGDLSPSPLIRALPETPLAEVLTDRESVRQGFERALQHSSALEPLETGHGPGLPPDVPAPGGSSLFKLQAACPFNAFARLRLGARLPDPPVMGLSPAERGTLLHGVLATLWKNLKTSEQLHRTPDDQLARWIAEICEQTLDPIRLRRPRELGPEYCALERERLQQMVSRWLELEKQRPPFTVEATEQRRQVEFQDLQLTLFIDRIDRLENGERLLIDYKTGSELKLTQWLGERPDEPQLPLYAVTDTDPVNGVAFAQLNPKALQWIGMGALSAPMPGVKPVEEWDAQQAEWHEVLSDLARGFAGGDARVDFKDANAQRFEGDLVPLNRVLEKDTIARFLVDLGG